MTNLVGKSPKLPVRFMGKHPVFGKTKRTRAPDGSIRDTVTGVRFERSPYYWWWRALRLSERYKDACINGGKTRRGIRRLYSDFGDIFSRDFEPWWRERGATLFGEPPAPMNVRLVDIDDVESYRATVGNEQTLLVAIPLFLSKKEIATKLRKLVAKKHKGKRGRSAVSTREALSKARYKLKHYKNIDSVSRAIQIVEKRNAGALLKSLLKNNTEEISSVSRLNRMGKTLVRHAELGIFPVTKKS